jgi:hypothetical protein
MLGVIRVRIARNQIALVVLQCAIDRDRCAVGAIGAAVLTPCQLLRPILCLIERQHALAVSILEVIGQREPFVQYAPCPRNCVVR